LEELYSGSIRKRLIWIILLVTSLTGVFGYTGFVYWYMNEQYNRALDLSKTIALVISQDVAKIVLLNDVLVASEVTSNLKSFSSLNSLILYKLDKTPIFQYTKDGKPIQDIQKYTKFDEVFKGLILDICDSILLKKH
jgi:two-component system sensor histidine kinase AtoS